MPSGASEVRIEGGPGMNSVGVDLHRKRSHVAALDERGGELFSRRIKNDRDTFVALLGELDGESKLALEATYGWEWLAELVEDHGYELHLAHPLRTKAIASAGRRARAGCLAGRSGRGRGS